jgi:quinol-cytochrome oxidoreductase complex cytochrome b subunit
MSRAPDERARLRATSNNLVLHLHQPRVAAHAIRWTYTFGLGGLNILALLVLISTGVLQMFAYTPTPEHAYQSVVAMQTVAPYGQFLRNLHHWSANLLIVSTALHLLRVFYTGSFRGSRRRNWWLGLCLLGLVALANFTGYLLPWDQLAYWAVTVGTSMLSYFPGGDGLRHFILGSDTVAARTLTNFYVLHVVIIPLTIVLTVVYHIWRVRKDGFSANVRATTRVTTVPHLFGREVIFGLLMLCALLLWAMVVQAPLEQAADPLHPPNPNKAAWYFVGFQELLLHLHPLVGIVILPALIVSMLVALPELDAHTESTAIWFRARGGWRLALFGLGLGSAGMLAFIFSSELWLKRLVSPPGISNELFALAVRGVLPLLAGLGALWLLQSQLRHRGVPPSARWMVLGSVLVAAYLTLTAVGLFLRGPDMALTLFWRSHD